MNPADLNSRSLYTNRQDLFELRLNEIEGAELDDLLMEMEKTYNNYYGVTNSEITWDCFTNFEQIKVSAVFLHLINYFAAVFKRFSQFDFINSIHVNSVLLADNI